MKWLLLLIGLIVVCSVSAVITDDELAYYKLDDNWIDSHDSLDATNVLGGPVFIPGKINNMPYLQGDDVGYNISPVWSNLGGNGMTLNFWFNITANTVLMGFGENNDNCYYSIRVYSPEFSIRVINNGATVLRCSGDSPIADGQLYMGTFIMNGSGTSFYINGSKETTSCSVGTTATVLYPSTMGCAQDWMMIGAIRYNSVFTYTTNAGMDELGIWNRTVTESELTELYNNNNGLAYPFSVPITPPSISSIVCTSPNPNDTTEPYWTNDNTPTFTLNTNQNANCSISDSNSTYTACTSTGIQAHTCTVPVGDTLSERNESVFFNCTTGTAFTTQRVNMYIDTINPDITYNSPDSGIIQALSVDLNMTCADNTNVNNITLYVNDSIVITNTTPVNDTPWAYTYTNAMSGNYTTFFRCWDNVSTYNYNTTETRWFNLVTRELVINWTYGSGILYNNYCFGIVDGKQCLGTDASTPTTDNSTYWLCTAANCATSCQVDIRYGKVYGCT